MACICEWKKSEIPNISNPVLVMMQLNLQLAYNA